MITQQTIDLIETSRKSFLGMMILLCVKQKWKTEEISEDEVKFYIPGIIWSAGETLSIKVEGDKAEIKAVPSIWSSRINPLITSNKVGFLVSEYAQNFDYSMRKEYEDRFDYAKALWDIEKPKKGKK